MKLADLFIKLGLKSDDYKKGIDQAQQKTNAFTAGLKKIGGIIAGAFAVDRIISFTSELIKLGGEAQGVRSAFERIADQRTLLQLQDAVKGTVSELELMKRAVQANNLGIPIQNLASLFQFATKRAQDTGESVDYLVNSIVTGIGRKSPLILDNLGISAVQLKEKLHGVGMETASVGDIAKAVGEIAADAMSKTGDILDTTAIKIQRNTARWQDLKTKWGELITESKILAWVLDRINNDLAIANSDLPWYEKYWYRITFQHTKGAERAKEYTAELAALADESSKDTPLNDNLKETVDTLDKVAESAKKAKIEVGGLMVGAGPKMQTRSETPQIGQGMAPMPSGLGDMTSHFEMLKEQYNTFYAEMKADETLFLQQMNDIAKYGMVDLVSTFMEGFGRLAAGDIGFQEFADAILSQIGAFLKQMGEMLIAYGIGMEAFKKAFTNPIAAIVAGAALVAIGGAISGMASRGPAGYSGAAAGAGGGLNIKTVDRYDQQQELVARVSGRDLEFVMQQRSNFKNKL